MYYKITDEYVYKYDVILNIKKLHDIKNEIIDKCSFISHKRYKTKNPSKPNMVNCRNYKKTKINDCEYLIEYDCLEIPMLVNYIIDLLSGKFFVIDKIINYKEDVNGFNLDEKKVLEEQDKIIKELVTETSQDISKKLELIANNHKRIMAYKKDRELNKNQVPASSYIKKVLSCINMKEVGLMPLTSVLESQKFLKDSKETTTESDLYKKLTLTKGTIK